MLGSTARLATLSWLTAVLTAGCTQCGSEPTAPGGAAPGADPRDPVATAVAARPAFDLVATRDGALLVYAPEGGGLAALRLDARGHRYSELASLTGGTSELVHEVAAARGEQAVAVAWVSGEPPRAWVARSPDGGRRWLTPEALGPSVALPRAGGRVAVSFGGGRFVVHHQLEPSPCRLTPGPCAHVARHTVGRGDSTPEERDFLREEVDHPCDPLIVDSFHHLGSAFHALCHHDGEIVFVIDPEPALATPVEIPHARTPTPLIPLDAVVAVPFRDRNGIARATLLDPQGEVLDRLSNTIPVARCVEGRPTLILTGDGGAAYPRTLAEAAEHLGGLLPQTSAGEVVWTGEVLLRAAWEAGTLSLERYECLTDDRFLRTDQGSTE